MKIVIIDDELDAVEALTIMLTDFIGNVEIVGTANTAIEGIKLINNFEPDLVFLDIEMPHGNGFDVLEGVSKKNFKLVFTTAYAHYAIKAIKQNAVDYLMKPIDIDELKQAVEKVEEELKDSYTTKNEQLLNMVQIERINKIPISLKNEYLLLDLEDIQFIKSDGSYSIIHTFDQHYTTAKNLKYYEGLLSTNGFIRVSNSHMINIEKVVKFIREDGGIVELRNKMKIPVSRSRKEELKFSLGI